MKKVGYLFLIFGLFFGGFAFAEEAKKEEPKKVEAPKSRAKELQELGQATVAQYKKVVDQINQLTEVKKQLELQVAKLNGQIEENKRQDDAAKEAAQKPELEKAGIIPPTEKK